MKLPQLTLRDLFWLVLVAALVCAWWLDRGRLTAQLAEEKSRVQNILSRLGDSDVRRLLGEPDPIPEEGMTYSGGGVEIIRNDTGTK